MSLAPYANNALSTDFAIALSNRPWQIINGDTTSNLYDAANRLATADGFSYAFDSNGNLLTTASMTNTWDAAVPLEGHTNI